MHDDTGAEGFPPPPDYGDAVVTKFLARFLSDDRGASGIEYGLVVGLVGLVVLGAAPQLSSAGASSLGAINGALSGGHSSKATPESEPPLKSRNFVN